MESMDASAFVASLQRHIPHTEFQIYAQATVHGDVHGIVGLPMGDGKEAVEPFHIAACEVERGMGQLRGIKAIRHAIEALQNRIAGAYAI